jgi:hypothetical protein
MKVGSIVDEKSVDLMADRGTGYCVIGIGSSL